MPNRRLLLALVAAAAGATAPTAHAAAPVKSKLKDLKITVLSTMLADDGIGEWGFAALVESGGKKILFDTGARPRTVLDNARELKIDLGEVENVVFSHFHDDHTTGLMTLRRELMTAHPNAMARVHIGKGGFDERRGGMRNPVLAWRKDYEATGGRFIEHDRPVELLTGVWLTGPIPRPNPERNHPPKIEVKRGGTWVPDDVADDQALVFDTPRGLVVLSGCGHAGIINTIEYARSAVRVAPVAAVIGGFHLYAARPETLKWTARKLKDLKVAQLLGAHCTGIESVYVLRQLMGLARKDALVAAIESGYDLATGIRTGPIASGL